jgi:hypothetical protein
MFALYSGTSTKPNKINLLKVKIMKTLKLKTLFVLCVAAMAVSCNNDDDKTPVYPQENPLQGYLTTSGFDEEVTTTTDAAATESGFRFRPTVTGVVTALTARIPDVNNNLRVTIWDVATGDVVKTELFNITSSGVAVTKAITALPLVKDKEYMITMNSGDYYRHEKTDGTDASYPFTVGNIQVTGSGYALGADQTYPYVFPVDYTNGDLSFTFQRIQ